MYRPPAGPIDRMICSMVQAQKFPVIGIFFRQGLKLRGIDIPPASLCPGKNLIVRHAGHIVVHVRTRIGCNVMLHQGVTIGRADVWQKEDPSFDGFEICDNVVLGANSVVVSSKGLLRVGEGTVLGANSVLNQSTGPYEIWAGVPARLIGRRVFPEG